MSDVGGVQNIISVAESVEMKLHRGVVSERHEPNATDQTTVGRPVDIEHLHELADKPCRLLEVPSSDAPGRVQQKHDVGAVCASYAKKETGMTIYHNGLQRATTDHNGP